MDILLLVGKVVYAVAALLMVGAILLQEGKGGGLSALGGTAAESAFGSSNPIRRATVYLAILFFFLAGFLCYMSPDRAVSLGEKEEEKGAPATVSPAPPEKGEQTGAGREGGGPSQDLPAAPETR